MKDYGVDHFEAYVDFISIILGCAPDRFIREDFLADEDQLTLENSFGLMREQFPLVEARLKNKEIIPEIMHLLDASLTAYRAGEEIKGAHLIQDFRDLILKNARRGRV